ncbi:MAG: hypothetical protein HYZ17_18095 [Betaproteobacteria bacterium]|nr:hypothetical protein [Betaproteobacteria bacterium]
MWRQKGTAGPPAVHLPRTLFPGIARLRLFRKRPRTRKVSPGAPFPRRIITLAGQVDTGLYRFDIPAPARGLDIDFCGNVTFIHSPIEAVACQKVIEDSVRISSLCGKTCVTSVGARRACSSQVMGAWNQKMGLVAREAVVIHIDVHPPVEALRRGVPHVGSEVVRFQERQQTVTQALAHLALDHSFGQEAKKARQNAAFRGAQVHAGMSRTICRETPPARFRAGAL